MVTWAFVTWFEGLTIVYIVRLLALEHQNSGLLKFPVVVRRLQLIKNWGDWAWTGTGRQQINKKTGSLKI